MNTCSIDSCDRAVMARGWCRAHYKRWHRHGDPLATVNRRAPDGATADERLRYVGWTKRVVRAEIGACWEWDGLKDARGYGRVWDGSRAAGAHRLAFEAWVRPLGDALGCHRCDNPPCINPAHLYAGSNAVNMADMVARRRSDNGETRWSVKLSDADVAAIRAAYTGERGQQTRIAEQYGVSQSRISTIVRGKGRVALTHKVAE